MSELVRPDGLRPSFISRLKWILWGAVEGGLLTAFAFFIIFADGEDRLFKELVANVTTPAMSREEQAIALLHAAHDLLRPRHAVFNAPEESLGLREQYLRSSGFELNAPRGACGSFSTVLCRSLQIAGFRARLVQMKVGAVWAGHVVVEAEVEPGCWAVLDPTYDLSFVRPDGELAGANDVHKDWAFYRHQVPNEYDSRYAYDELRYTNWNKIPVLMPALRWVIVITCGEQFASVLSIRACFLNLFRVYAWSSLVLAILPAGFVLAQSTLRHRRPGSKVETASNPRAPADAGMALRSDECARAKKTAESNVAR
ncbi:MAG: hypothetical protein U1D55_03775 [Phycisphaerae bacterium]